MLKHIKRWSVWRKGSRNDKLYKLLVLLKVTKSPTFEQLKNVGALDVERYKVKMTGIDHFTGGEYHKYRVCKTAAEANIYATIMRLFYAVEVKEETKIALEFERGLIEGLRKKNEKVQE